MTEKPQPHEICCLFYVGHYGAYEDGAIVCPESESGVSEENGAAAANIGVGCAIRLDWLRRDCV